MKLIKPHTLTVSLIALTHSLCVAAPAGKSQQLTSPDQVPEGLKKSEWTSNLCKPRSNASRSAYCGGRFNTRVFSWLE